MSRPAAGDVADGSQKKQPFLEEGTRNSACDGRSLADIPHKLSSLRSRALEMLRDQTSKDDECQLGSHLRK